MSGRKSISVKAPSGETAELLRALQQELDAHPMEPGDSIEITVSGPSGAALIARVKELLAGA